MTTSERPRGEKVSPTRRAAEKIFPSLRFHRWEVAGAMSAREQAYTNFGNFHGENVSVGSLKAVLTAERELIKLGKSDLPFGVSVALTEAQLYPGLEKVTPLLLKSLEDYWREEASCQAKKENFQALESTRRADAFRFTYEVLFP